MPYGLVRLPLKNHLAQFSNKDILVMSWTWKVNLNIFYKTSYFVTLKKQSKRFLKQLSNPTHSFTKINLGPNSWQSIHWTKILRKNNSKRPFQCCLLLHLVIRKNIKCAFPKIAYFQIGWDENWQVRVCYNRFEHSNFENLHSSKDKECVGETKLIFAE